LVKVIASIEDPKVIELILKHRKQKATKTDATIQRKLPPERAPPGAPSLFDPSQTRLFDYPLKAYTASFTAAGGADYIQCATNQ